MLYFWILTVILFALPVGLVMLTWDRSQADARECVIRWQIIASALYFLATGPTSQGGETALLMMLLGALIAATALLVRHCTGGHGQGYSRVMAERSVQRYSAKAVRPMGMVKVRAPAASACRAR